MRYVLFHRGSSTPCIRVAVAFIAFCLATVGGGHRASATTLYWTAGDNSWSTSTTVFPWATTSTGSASTAWTNGYDAEIVTANPNIHVWNATVGTLTIDNGATFYASGTTSVTRGLIITGGGSGDFTVRDDRTSGGTSLKISLNGTSAWNGTATIIGSSTSTVSLVIGSTASTGANATGVDTKVTLEGGNLEVGYGLVGSTATIGQLSGTGTVKLDGTYSNTAGTRTLRVEQSANTTFNGSIGANQTRTDNILAFVKAGSGTLAVNGSGGYAGQTTVEGGKLYLNGSYGTGITNVNGQGDYVVKNGATLGINGTITLSTGSSIRGIVVENGGILQAGTPDTAGTLTLAGGSSSSVGLLFQGNATIEFRLGVTQDLITLSNTAMTGSALGGDNSIAFDFIYNGGDILNQTLDLISFGGTTTGIALSTFTLSQAAVESGWAGTFSYGGDGNLLQFTIISVPEPRIWMFMMAGLLLVFGVIYRRNRQTISTNRVGFLGISVMLFLAISFTARAENLIPNPGFEAGMSRWKSPYIPADSQEKGCVFTLSETDTHSGQFCAAMEAAEPGARMAITPANMPLAVQLGSYHVTVWVRAGENFRADPSQTGMLIRLAYFSGANKTPLKFQSIDWKGHVLDGVNPSGWATAPVPKAWTEINAVIDVPNGAERLAMDLFLWRATGKLYFDDVSIIRE